MEKLHRHLRLSSLRDELETRLLGEEFRSAMLDDPFDDGREREFRSRLSDLSRQIFKSR